DAIQKRLGVLNDEIQSLLPRTSQSEPMLIQLVRRHCEHPVEFEYVEKALKLGAARQDSKPVANLGHCLLGSHGEAANLGRPLELLRDRFELKQRESLGGPDRLRGGL